MHARSLPLAGLLALAACTSLPRSSPAATPLLFEASKVPTESAERWIEVMLDEQKVYLHEGGTIVAVYDVASGAGESPETTTPPGEYNVLSMWPGPEESAPGVFVRDVVVFDWIHGNGFHSLPMDDEGNVLDETLGQPATAGCIRLADSRALYDFARLGMQVVIR